MGGAGGFNPQGTSAQVSNSVAAKKTPEFLPFSIRFKSKTGLSSAFLVVNLVSGVRFPAPRDTTPLAGPADCGVGTSSLARRPRRAIGGFSRYHGSEPS